MTDIDGYTAVLLWHDYRRTGNTSALETLLAYNICDAVNLAALMTIAYNHAISQTPFADLHCPCPIFLPCPSRSTAKPSTACSTRTRPIHRHKDLKHFQNKNF